MLKAKITFVAIGLLSIIIVASPHVLAHETETDGDISVTMHVEPDDQAIQGTNQKLDFYVQDISKEFNALQCECTIVIHRNGKTVATLTPQVESDALSANYVFKNAGDYHITLSGSPTGSAIFDDFTESFPVKVAAEKKSSSNSRYIYGLIAAALVAVTILLFTKKRNITE